MFQVFQMFQRYVANASYGCYKSRLGILHMLHMLQVFQMNIASGFSKCFIYFKRMFARVFDLDIAYVSHICCKNMFQMFYMFQSN
jgi:hypothetical protein